MVGELAVLGAFDERLEAELRRLVDDAARGPAQWVEAVGCARRLVEAGGKRIRPKLCALAFLASGGQDGAEIGLVRFAAGIELLHTCMLVHDDVMDRSLVRRGVPSVHCAIQRSGVVSDSRLADGVAVVVGDVLATLATEEFAAEELPHDLARRAAAVVHHAMRDTAAGQVLDLTHGGRPIEAVSEEDILLTYRLKTAFFAFEAPLRSGAILARADDRVADALAEFGLRLGTAFQLRDDLIGFLGKQSLTGKRTVDDLREGKKTLLLKLLWNRCGAEDRARLSGIVGCREPDETELRRLQEVARETGAVAEVEGRITALSSEAASILGSVELIEPWRGHLTLLSAWLQRREA